MCSCKSKETAACKTTRNRPGRGQKPWVRGRTGTGRAAGGVECSTAPRNGRDRDQQTPEARWPMGQLFTGARGMKARAEQAALRRVLTWSTGPTARDCKAVARVGALRTARTKNIGIISPDRKFLVQTHALTARYPGNPLVAGCCRIVKAQLRHQT